MSIMKEEILATPALLEKALPVYAPIVRELAQAIRERNCRDIYTASRGTSGNAAQYFQYLCEVLLPELSCKAIQPSVITLMGGKPAMKDGVFLAVSQGGRGEDIRRLRDYARARGVLTVAATNEADSPLAQDSDTVIPLSMDLERSMAATKTYTAQLTTLGMLAFALAGGDPAEFDRVPGLFRRALEVSEAGMSGWDHYDNAKNCFVLARGALLPVAKELCCKLQETCLINTTPYSAADFLHGPFSLIEPGVQVILFHREDATGECTADMYRRLKENGAQVTVFTDSPTFGGVDDHVLRLPEERWELAPFCFTAASQMFACLLADRRGTDPDTSRNLCKYTVTV